MIGSRLSWVSLFTAASASCSAPPDAVEDPAPIGSAAAALLSWKDSTALDPVASQDDARFGATVALSGDIAIVGSIRTNVLGEGLNVPGTAYVFERDFGGTSHWGVRKQLQASDAQGHDGFGVSVAIAGDIAVVGADGAGNTPGAAYVFERDLGGQGNWGQRTKLTASDGQLGDLFGDAVAVFGDTIVVGARFKGAPGNPAGAAYVFERDLGGAENWGQAAEILPAGTPANAQFGTSVAVAGNDIVVGAPNEAVAAVGGGAAYVFERDLGGAANWGQRQRLVASDPVDAGHFGGSVAITGDVILIGAPA